MKGYLSIGKVAKAKNVSIKSLRYYDELGIFRPALTDHTTGYRYYKEEQLYILDAISLCVELGIPLKDLSNYMDGNHKPDLQRLLGDAKTIAEEKIRDMYKSLNTLQNTINTLEQKPNHKIPEGCMVRTLLSRTVLTSPFDEFTDMCHYNPKLLALFVGSQKLGLAGSYPSGLIYDHHSGKVDKYVFVTVEPLADESGTKNGSVPGNWGKNIEGLRTIGAGNYLCKRVAEHSIESAAEIFSLDKAAMKHATVIETNIPADEKDATGMSYELQVLL
ncbi:MAG: MerR family transcriptional regulator [Lachnospiraceae bacterium]|nr:MerR family transcriptional regulator [Lachnospiraceae bacterium]